MTSLDKQNSDSVNIAIPPYNCEKLKLTYSELFFSAEQDAGYKNVFTAAQWAGNSKLVIARQ